MTQPLPLGGEGALLERLPDLWLSASWSAPAKIGVAAADFCPSVPLSPPRGDGIEILRPRCTLKWVFSQIFGFPEFYGNNMDALIDCLGYLDQPEAAMTRLHVRPGQRLAIQLGAVISFRRRCPDLFEALQDACAFVNWRRTREHGAALVALSYYD
ncbi:barstar family protein [Burkholderia diffusa]|uniref:barstar family protein n=1 Tax=Burkholderia diffusa TaxID=488732 RepID=UPI0026556168|nr:barstar family protein [Burkholderia diffusa]MDN7903162.1 barstar family protein [Burkholderia diffusa]